MNFRLLFTTFSISLSLISILLFAQGVAICSQIASIPIISVIFGAVFLLLFILLLMRSNGNQNKTLKMASFVFLGLAILSFLMIIFGPFVIGMLVPSAVGAC